MAKTFRASIDLRFTDVDILGHVNNTKFLEFAQDARILFFHDAGVVMDADSSFVVRHMEIDFDRPLFLTSGPVVVELSILKIGNTSFTLRHAILDKNDQVAARIDAVIVGFAPKTNSALPLTAETRALCEEYLADS